MDEMLIYLQIFTMFFTAMAAFAAYKSASTVKKQFSLQFRPKLVLDVIEDNCKDGALLLYIKNTSEHPAYAIKIYRSFIPEESFSKLQKRNSSEELFLKRQDTLAIITELESKGEYHKCISSKDFGDELPPRKTIMLRIRVKYLSEAEGIYEMPERIYEVYNSGTKLEIRRVNVFPDDVLTKNTLKSKRSEK